MTVTFKQLRKPLRWGLLLIVFITGALLVIVISAQPVNDTIMDDVVVSDYEDGAKVKITYRCGMRYISHFPHYTGTELRINLKPAFSCASDDLNDQWRGAINLRGGNAVGLDSVHYEGDFETGPVTTLLFDRQVIFEVLQNSGRRSLTVVVHPVD